MAGKPCPNCLGVHGHSVWRVANSSAYMPLRCKACGQNFHQKSATLWVLAASSLPTGAAVAAFTAVIGHWASGVPSPWSWILATLLTVLIQLVVVVLYVNRKRPLVPGPRHG